MMNELKISNANQMATVVVSSCDKYEEAWYPFFALFRKYWSDCKFDVVLNTETKQCKEPGVKTVNAVGYWCERLNSVLENLKTPYIILLLEDFFIENTVNFEEIDRCINIMESEDDIACFYYKQISCNKNNELYYDRYLKLCPTIDNNMYILNLQAGLWRKSVLQDILKETYNRSPWDLECKGYDICKAIIGNKRFYCLSNAYTYDTNKYDVFPYKSMPKSGMGIRSSKWLWNNKKLFKREGLNIKYNDLKKMSYIEWYYLENAKPFIFNVKQFIKRRINRVLSIK